MILRISPEKSSSSKKNSRIFIISSSIIKMLIAGRIFERSVVQKTNLGQQLVLHKYAIILANSPKQLN
jgi:hypothetical protein